MITKIKDNLYNNEEKIRDILENLEFTKIRRMGNCYKFAWDGEGANTGVGNSLNIENLKFSSFSHKIFGDIITMVQVRRNTELSGAIKWLADFLKLDWEYSNNTKEITPPFGGFYLNYEKIKEDTFDYKTYDDSIVRKYEECGLSLYWIKDGISALTQEHFRIGYDPYSMRITIPWFDEIGRCIGFQGRLDRSEVEDWECKYLPVIPFFKGNTLYGLYQAYNDIQNKGEVIIVESEKSVLKAYQIGITNVVAIGCHSLSPRQIKIIKSLAVDVCIAYDSDVPLEEMIEEGKNCIIDNIFFNNTVTVLDMDGLGDKISVFDLNKEVVDKTLEERRIYLG